MCLSPVFPLQLNVHVVYDFGRKEVDYFWKLHGVSLAMYFNTVNQYFISGFYAVRWLILKKAL
jgi:hypothetical protein